MTAIQKYNRLYDAIRVEIVIYIRIINAYLRKSDEKFSDDDVYRRSCVESSDSKDRLLLFKLHQINQ